MRSPSSGGEVGCPLWRKTRTYLKECVSRIARLILQPTITNPNPNKAIGTMRKTTILATLCLLPCVAYAQYTQQDACRDYAEAMGAIPHVELTIEDQKEFQIYDGSTHQGCSVAVETKWSLVGDNFRQHSVLGLAGWRQGGFIADGAGSSVYEMVRNGVFCMVGYDFMAYFDEQTDHLVSGDDLSMYADCAEKAK